MMSPNLSKEIEVHILLPDEQLMLSERLKLAAGFPALDSWVVLMGRICNFSVHRLVALMDKKIVGVLSLIRIKHLIFGDYLVTAPFASYGGLAFLSDQVRDALLENARILGVDLGVEYVNVRFASGDTDPPSGWLQHPVYATYLADLFPDTEKMLAAYDANHRNHIRKSLKKSFTVRFGSTELLDDAYDGLSKSMHELGSPYHNRAYLQALASSLGEDLEFAAIYNGSGKVVGAGVFIFSGPMVTNLHANILRQVRSDYAGEFLYWSVITRFSQKGFNTFDMGRSLIGSGNEVFKMKWNPKKQILAYWFYLNKGHDIPGLNQKNPKFRFVIWVWQRLPAFVVRLVGPGLIRGLA